MTPVFTRLAEAVGVRNVRQHEAARAARHGNSLNGSSKKLAQIRRLLSELEKEIG